MTAKKKQEKELDVDVKVQEKVEKVVKPDIKSSEDDFSAIFINESNTFDIHLRVYKDGDDFKIEDIDVDFDHNRAGIKEFTITFKYPSYADQEAIIGEMISKDMSELTVAEYIRLEENRVFALLRSWNFPSPKSQISKMDPKFIKAICLRVREKIGLKGII